MVHGKLAAKAAENKRKAELSPDPLNVNGNKRVKRSKAKDAIQSTLSKTQGKTIKRGKAAIHTDSNNSVQQIHNNVTIAGNYDQIPDEESNPTVLQLEGGNHGESKQTRTCTWSATRSLAEIDEFNNFDKLLSDNCTELANDEDGVVVGVRASKDEFESDSEDKDHERSRPEASITQVPQMLAQGDDRNAATGETSEAMSLSKNIGSSNDLQEMLLNQLVNERVKRQLAEEQCKAAERAIAEANLKSQEKPGQHDQEVMPERNTTPVHKQVVGKESTLLKSVSDTTIYAPMLSKIGHVNDTNAGIDKISNFVENIHVEEQTSHGSPGPGVGSSSVEKNGTKTTPTHRNLQQPRAVSDQLIVEVEKFKASVATPQGEFNLLTHFKSKLDVRRFLDTDDDFFHISCHIDQSLRSKIKQGGFVDLEKLLLKDRVSSRGSLIEGDRLSIDLVSKEGHTYLAPAQCHNVKINGIRRWEQAFHIYTAIYMQANLNRASEIWQYIYTINLATSSYNWENVAFYDFTFRQLMAEKPWRSWAKTYTQGWNLALGDGSINRWLYHSGPSSNNNNNSFVGGGRKDWKDDCCWHFNKNKCKKSNQECAFDHRCAYCSVWNHSFYNCRKRQAKRGGNNNGGKHYHEEGASPSGHEVNSVSKVVGAGNKNSK